MPPIIAIIKQIVKNGSIDIFFVSVIVFEPCPNHMYDTGRDGS